MLLPVNTLPSPLPLDNVEDQAQPNAGYVEELTKILEMTTEADRETLLADVTKNFDAAKFGLKQQAIENVGTVEEFVNYAIDQGQLTPEQFRMMLDDVSRKQETLSRSPSISLEAYLLSGNEGMTPADIRATTNLSLAEAKLTAAIAANEEDTSIGEGLLWGVDNFIRQITIGSVEDLTRRTERISGEILDAAVHMEPDEFEQYFDNYVKELEQEGILLGDNTAALQRGLQELTSYGYDENAGLNQALALVDIATTVSPFAIVKGVRGAAKGISTAATSGAREALVATRKAGGAIHKIAAAKGTEQALEAATRAIAKGDQKAVTQISPQILDPEIPPVRTTSQASRILAENELVKKVDDIIESGVAGRAITKEELTTLTDKIVDRFTKRVGQPVFNLNVIRDFAQDYRVAIQLGKKSDGKPYASMAAATKAAKNNPELTIVPVDAAKYNAAKTPKEYKEGFVLEYQERVRSAGQATGLDTNFHIGPLKNIYAKFLGGSATLDDTANTVLAGMGEAATSSIVALARPMVQKINAISVESRETLDRVMSELRDGVDANLRSHYTDAEFKRKFREHHPRGLDPSKKDLEAYRAAITIEDAAYLMQASRMLNVFVENRFKAITFNGRRYVAREVNNVDSIPLSETILDPKGFGLPREQLKGQQVWQLAESLDGDITYVVKPDSVDTLMYDDVLGYNPGGRRTYTQANYIVVHGTKKDGWAGKIAARTEKEAKKAVNQLETLRKAVLDKGGLDKLDESFDDLLVKNNDWNTDIDTFSAFAKWVEDNKINLNRAFSWKANKGLVEAGEAGGIATPDGLTWGQRVAMQMSRSDTPLTQFGGGKAHTLDPLLSIGRQYTTGANRLANQAAVRRSIDKWVNYVKDNPQSGWQIDAADLQSGDYYRMFRNARMVGDTTKLQSRLDHMRNVYLNRFHMGEPGSLARAYEASTKELAEYILDSSFGKYSATEWMSEKLLNGRPADSLLRMGFGVTFGFFNFAQLAVQSIHGLVTAPVIAGWSGAKAAGLLLPMRAAIAVRGTKAGDLLIKRIASFSGLSEKDVTDFIEFATKSGRLTVSGEAIEQGTGAALDVAKASRFKGGRVAREALHIGKKTAGKAFDASLGFYRAGEQTTRFSSMLISFIDFKKRFPKGDVFSEDGLRWIYEREQNLSFHMTNSARSAIQQGVGRVPTQWLSYPMRAFEAVFIGRGLTKAERLRAALVLGPMYGMSGIGLASAADSVAEWLGIEPGDDFYIGLKYGLLDYLLQEAGAEISVSDRFSPVAGLIDIYTTITSESPVSIALGPSGEIVGGTVGALWGAVAGLWNGTPQITTEKVGRVLRTISSLDNIAKAYGILEFGTLRTKNYGMVPGQFDTKDAIFQFLGFSPIEVTEFAKRRKQKFDAEAQVNAFRKELNGMADKAFERIRSEDPDRREQGFALLEDISIAIETSPFSESTKDSLRKSLVTERQDRVLELSKFLLTKEGDAYAAQAFQEIMKGE